jgi:hypothetical protein
VHPARQAPEKTVKIKLAMARAICYYYLWFKLFYLVRSSSVFSFPEEKGKRRQDMHARDTHARDTMEIKRSHKDRSQDPSATDVPAFIPRLWLIMILFTIPFFNVSVHFFEALERTGPIWTFFAAPLLAATAIAYVALIFALKKRNL